MRQDAYFRTIGNIGTAFGLVFVSKTISDPEPQTNYVEIPGRNGSLDMSSVLTGHTAYRDRTVSIQYVYNGPVRHWRLIETELRMAIEGGRTYVIFNDDPVYYWVGRFRVETEPNGASLNIRITGTVDPFKYGVDQRTFTNTLLNPQRYAPDEVDIARIRIEADTTNTVQMDGYKLTQRPIFTWIPDTPDATATLKFGSITKTLKHGANSYAGDILFTSGSNIMQVTGASGYLTINTTGGSL